VDHHELEDPMSAALEYPSTFPSIDDLLPQLAEAGLKSDQDDSFVAANIAALAERGILQALVPAELGGGGIGHSVVADLLRRIAHACPSTALSLSMHQHLVSAAIFRWRKDGFGEALLKKVATGKVILVSTGANDWLESSGSLTPAEGGYRLNGAKAFASGSAGGQIVVTSGRLERDGQTQVLHFGVPLDAPGVKVRQDWQAMGMRGTGSNTVEFTDVFIPEASISLTRPAGEFHPVWNVILTVAMPLIMSVYTGIAERAAEIATSLARHDDATFATLGQMHNALTAARLATRRMVEICNDLSFVPSLETTNEVLACRTIAGREAINTVDHAITAVGGRAYFRKSGLEKLARDIRAAQFHPVQEPKQVRMAGRIMLGLGPIG
jgi:alkylation response protein AidB-like acyl-CoA dehydrogenase